MAYKALGGRRRRMFMALTTACSVIIALALVERGRLDPVPQRFPEASDAFLYSMGIGGVLTALLAVISIALGFHVRAIWRRKMAAKRGRGSDPHRDRLRANLSFASGIALSAVALPLLWCDAESYSALTDEGFVGRSYLRGTISHEPWTSLHHVEFECSGAVRLKRSRNVVPALSLRFVGGESVRDVLSMIPYGTAKADAVAHFEQARAANHVPLIWKDGAQEAKFHDRNAEIAECVDNLLQLFPAEQREPIMAMLTGRARLRVENIPPD